MKNPKMTTITIGIPVYNESSNIAYLLHSILRQKAISYQLEKIIVTSDGSTDDTVQKVKKIAQHYPQISLIVGTKRVGKQTRLRQLYHLNKSDKIIICDGDVVLGRSDTIEKMVKYFSDQKVAIVSGNNQPIVASTYVGKLINTWRQLWYEIRKDYNGGDNIYNCRGSILALEKNFAKSLNFPKIILSDAQYTYFWAKEKGYSFRFAKDALVYYRNPLFVKDYLYQKKRSRISGRTALSQHFGSWIRVYFQIPSSYKIVIFLREFIKNPVFVFPSLIFYLWLKVLSSFRKDSISHNKWEIASSTKEGIDKLFSMDRSITL